jgi:predicted lipoprotein with Yx(FWY)xxD motif
VKSNSSRAGGTGRAEGRRTSRGRGRSGWVVAPVVAGVLTVTASCSSSRASAPEASGSSQPATSGALLSTASTGIGTVLVDGDARTVYEFANDRGGRSTCTGSCTTDWPPVGAPAALPSSLPGVPGRLGTTTRDDGSAQLTVAGHPVYTFAGDSAPGQTNGQGITLNGGLWTAVSPAGDPVQSKASATPKSSTTY